MGTLENAKHERFCQEYIIDNTGTQAAIRAGYSPKNAAAQATTLLKRADVLDRIAELRKKQAQRLGLNADLVLIETMNVYRRCMRAEPVLEWNFETKKYEETGEWKFDSKGALRALELIGKHLGMFTQKVQVSGNADELTKLGDIMAQLGMAK